MMYTPSSRSIPGTILTVVTLALQIWSADAEDGAPARRLVTSNTRATGVTPFGASQNHPTLWAFTGVGPGPATNDKFEFIVAGLGCSGNPAYTVTCSPSCTGTQTLTNLGNHNLCYQQNSNIDNIIQTTDGTTLLVLVVVAASSQTQFTAASPVSIQLNTATSITLTGTALAGTHATIAQECDYAYPDIVLTVGTNAVTSFTVTSYGPNFRVCIRAPGGSDSAPQDDVFLTVVNPAAGNDPVAFFGDKMRVFNLPPNNLLPLLSASDMTLYGSTFYHEGPWQQWFGRMVLASPDGSRWVQISMKNDILEFNRSRHPKGHFETLEVVLGHGSFDDPTMRTVVPSPNIEIPLSFLGFDVVFWKMPRNAQATNTMVGAAHRECMEVAGAQMHFWVCSAPASEFFGWQRHLAVKNAHLDLEVVEVTGQDLKGILPELWGMQPMSKTTESYIAEDIDRPEFRGSSNKDGVGLNALLDLPKGASMPAGKAWAGGFGIKDSNFCTESNKTGSICDWSPNSSASVIKESQTVLTV